MNRANAAQLYRATTRIALDNTVLVAFLLLAIALAFTTPYFLTSRNILNILLQAAPFVILALGELAVVLVAGIDLSVGSMVGLSGVLFAFLTVSTGLPWPLAIAVAIAACTTLGIVQGALINYFNVADFVATLAGLSIFRGLTLIITQGDPIPGLPPAFNFLGQGFIGPIPFPVIIMASLWVVTSYWLSKSRSGVHIYAIGGGRTAAHRAGIPVARMRMLLYGFSAFMASIAGLILAARLGTADPTAGATYELATIAAVVIGGTSLFGGRGSAWGAALGALILATILNGLTLLDVPPFYTELVQGLIIVTAVLLDNLRRRTA
ncbi:ABC transporter permease [Salinisphaera sp. USBA-960]|uniref:ABC transporter permease n=1 Tax=Salinisphaera orenii TaxID=856731 RepID=UPI000DBE7D0B|nr:ABC transporter permease [Salifodinibacter halophilus]NNC26142.1 ABC transporter permease [Salifodinibacter halophilus]